MTIYFAYKNQTLMTQSQQLAKEEALEKAREDLSSLNIINVNSFTKLANQSNTLDQMQGRKQIRS